MASEKQLVDLDFNSLNTATGLRAPALASDAMRLTDSPLKWGGVSTNSGNAYTITTTPATTAYVVGQSYLFYANFQNTNTSPTLRVDALSYASINKEDGIAPAIGDIKTGLNIVTYMAGGDWRLHRDGSAVHLSNNETIAGTKTFSSPIVIPDGVAATDGVALRQVPFDNLFINAGMRMAQRGASFAAVADAAYTLDRWAYHKVGTMVHTVSQDTDVPTVAQAGVLIPYSMKLVLTTADTAIAAGDYCFVRQSIEGYNYQRIAQRAFALSFWVKATTAGIYSIVFRNSGADRSYISNFTISATNTWELKTVAVSASPSTGTWNYTSGIGLSFCIVLAVGSTFHASASIWQSGSFFGTSSNINGVNTGATNFWFTTPVVNPGTIAATFKSPDIATELSMCERYYWKTFLAGVTPVNGAGYNGAIQYISRAAGVTNFDAIALYRTLMRATPTVVTYNPVSANANWRNLATVADSGVPAVVGSDDWKTMIRNPQVAGDGAQQNIYIHATFDAEL